MHSTGDCKNCIISWYRSAVHVRYECWQFSALSVGRCSVHNPNILPPTQGGCLIRTNSRTARRQFIDNNMWDNRFKGNCKDIKLNPPTITSPSAMSSQVFSVFLSLLCGYKFRSLEFEWLCCELFHRNWDLSLSAARMCDNQRDGSGSLFNHIKLS